MGEMTDAFAASRYRNLLDRRFKNFFAVKEIKFNDLVVLYLLNAGFGRNVHVVRRLLIDASKRLGIIGRGDELLDPYGRLQPAIMERAGHDFSDYYKPTSSDYRVQTLYETEANEWYDATLPKQLFVALAKPERTALKLYSAERASTFVDYCGYQVCTADERAFFPSASPFCYTNQRLSIPATSVEGDIVICGDIFDGSNFCHFLLDWLPRLDAFCTAGLYQPGKTKFVMGGIPGDLHRLLTGAVANHLAIDTGDIVFPDRRVKFAPSGATYWFSDASEVNVRPGQLMRSSTVRFLRGLQKYIDAAASRHGAIERLYISRADATNRRVANEPSLIAALTKLNFKVVQLSRLPIEDQIRTVCDSAVIVAPHGMGLTHLAFTNANPAVVECFHPNKGTGAYAILSRSMGCDYRFVIGAEAPNSHFNVSIDAVVHAVNDSNR